MRFAIIKHATLTKHAWKKINNMKSAMNPPLAKVSNWYICQKRVETKNLFLEPNAMRGLNILDVNYHKFQMPEPDWQKEARKVTRPCKISTARPKYFMQFRTWNYGVNWCAIWHNMLTDMFVLFQLPTFLSDNFSDAMKKSLESWLCKGTVVNKLDLDCFHGSNNQNGFSYSSTWKSKRNTRQYKK